MMTLKSALTALVAAAGLTGCNTEAMQQREFEHHLRGLCGKAFAGEVVSEDAVDSDWRGKPIVMHVRDCTSDTVRIALDVDGDRSRTWVLDHEDGKLALHHEHRHEDGSFDALTGYGGVRSGPLSGRSIHFPADEATKALFDAQGIPASKENVWTLTVRPTILQYELNRPERHFLLEFDLMNPVDPPPAAWVAD